MDRRKNVRRRHAPKRRRHVLGRVLAVVAVLTFCGAASVPVLLTLSQRAAERQHRDDRQDAPQRIAAALRRAPTANILPAIHEPSLLS